MRWDMEPCVTKSTKQSCVKNFVIRPPGDPLKGFDLAHTYTVLYVHYTVHYNILLRTEIDADGEGVGVTGVPHKVQLRMELKK